QLPGGYIALMGSPGSGKSTTLTQTFRYRLGIRLIRYYAFVRDDPSQGRGEAQNFLHDLTLVLHKQGLRESRPGLAWTRAEYLEARTKQLAQASNDWRENQTRTLIVVDGLDHIEREQSPER